MNFKHKYYINANNDISLEAQAMLAVYSTLGLPLVGIERSSMITYVDSEVLDLNHHKKDYEVIYPLTGVNGLIDYKGSKVATAINAPIHDINGYTLNGTTQYIIDNFIPNIDGVNFQQNDGIIGAFIKTSLEIPAASAAAIWGTNGGAPDNILRYNNAAINMFSRHNDLTSGSIIIASTVSGDYEMLERHLLSNYNHIRNGGVPSNKIANSTGLSTLTPYSGARNNLGVADLHLNGTITTKLYTGSVGFNPTTNNTNLRTLLTSLGTLP